MGLRTVFLTFVSALSLLGASSHAQAQSVVSEMLLDSALNRDYMPDLQSMLEEDPWVDFTEEAYEKFRNMEDVVKKDWVVRGSYTDAMVLLGEYDVANDMMWPFCSGTLVAPNIVLTARHCIENKDLRSVAFLAGEGQTRQGRLISHMAAMDTPKVINNMTGPDGEDWLNDGRDRKEVWRRDAVLLFFETPITDIKPIKILNRNMGITQFAGLGEMIIGYPGDHIMFGEDQMPRAISNLRACKVYEETLTESSFVSNCIARPGNSGGAYIVFVNGEPYVAGVASTIAPVMEKTDGNPFWEMRATTTFVNMMHESQDWIRRYVP